jgi:hypothetical protein
LLAAAECVLSPLARCCDNDCHSCVALGWLALVRCTSALGNRLGAGLIQSDADDNALDYVIIVNLAAFDGPLPHTTSSTTTTNLRRPNDRNDDDRCLQVTKEVRGEE